MPLGLTPVLATYSGQSASWSLENLNSAVAAYSGSTARVVFKYRGGTSFTGDIQLDAITLGGTTAGFEAGIDSYQTSTSTDGATSAYTSVTSWTALQTSTLAGRWNRDTGTTPSAGTGGLGAYAGSYFVYAETSGVGTPSKYFWLRGPEIVITPAVLQFALGRQGATIGTIEVYLDITAEGNTDVSVSVTNVVGTTALGSVGVAIGQTAPVTGVSAAGAVGNETVSTTSNAVVPYSGWGRSGWVSNCKY
jgi:hypothetical protein